MRGPSGLAAAVALALSACSANTHTDGSSTGAGGRPDGGDLRTLPDAGDAGTAPDAGDAGELGSVCGPNDFTVSCFGGTVACPSHADCVPGGCACQDPFIAASCAGQLCGQQTSCMLGDWWCAPVSSGACGFQNFTVVCPLTDGGFYRCPTHGTCEAGPSCGCSAGFSAAACQGSGCSGAGCQYPNWWCGPG